MKELLVFLFQLIFGYFDGDDATKHKRIASLVLICLMVVPTFLYGLGVYQRFQWFKNNPNSGSYKTLAPSNTAPTAALAAPK